MIKNAYTLLLVIYAIFSAVSYQYIIITIIFIFPQLWICVCPMWTHGVWSMESFPCWGCLIGCWWEWLTGTALRGWLACHFIVADHYHQVKLFYKKIPTFIATFLIWSNFQFSYICVCYSLQNYVILVLFSKILALNI